MASLLELLSQKQPQFQTHQALLILSLQNDFVSKSGRLPVTLPTGSGSDFLDRIKDLVPTFRESAGDIVWIKTLYRANRLVNDSSGSADAVVAGNDAEDKGAPDSSDEEEGGFGFGDSSTARELIAATSSRNKGRSSHRALEILKKMSASKKKPSTASTDESDTASLPRRGSSQQQEQLTDEELFLTQTPSRPACCVPGTPGADFSNVALELKESTDLVMNTSHYSAFHDTDFLISLRARLVTSLYICGCVTNTTIYATAMDAARHGFSITIIDDCLGYRKRTRHEQALHQMVEIMGANVVSCEDILDELRGEKEVDGDADGLEDLVGNLAMDGTDSKPSSFQGHRSKDRAASSNHSIAHDDAGPKSPTTTQTPSSPRSPEIGSEKRNSLGKARLRMRKKPSTSKAGESGSSSPAHSRPSSVVDTSKSKATSSTSNVAEGRGVPSKHASLPNMLQAALEDGRRAKPASSNSYSKDESPQTRPKSSGSPSKKSECKADIKPSIASKISGKADNSAMAPKSPSSWSHRIRDLSNLPIQKPGDKIAEGESSIIHDLLPPSSHLLNDVFARLYTEVRFANMSHASGSVPRLIAVQASFDDASTHLRSPPTSSAQSGPWIPLYRHPADSSPLTLRFSPTVLAIRDVLAERTGQTFNHVLIQLYRGGTDHISEHSDKTLDIVPGSLIANASFGAQRVMRLRTKRAAQSKQPGSDEVETRETQRVAMPHNSLFLLGPASNARWLHGIQPDKRVDSAKNADEKAFGGWRISLTFRQVGTFINADGTKIWGQGARIKLLEDLVGEKGKVLCGDDGDAGKEEKENLLKAFGMENRLGIAPPSEAKHSKANKSKPTERKGSHSHESVSEDRLPTYDEVYSPGYNIVHFTEPDPIHSNTDTHAKLFASADDHILTGQVAILLRAFRVPTRILPPSVPRLADALPGIARNTPASQSEVLFRDTDAARSEVRGAYATLLYLERWHANRRCREQDAYALTAAKDALKLELACRNGDTAALRWWIKEFGGRLRHADFLSGAEFGAADAVLLAVLLTEESGRLRELLSAYVQRCERVVGLVDMFRRSPTEWDIAQSV
jgi:nicotinamidase-related amidase/alkylated DNA repair dioxygenase AlkB